METEKEKSAAEKHRVLSILTDVNPARGGGSVVSKLTQDSTFPRCGNANSNHLCAGYQPHPM